MGRELDIKSANTPMMQVNRQADKRKKLEENKELCDLILEMNQFDERLFRFLDR
jgi:hypothetical protein